MNTLVKIALPALTALLGACGGMQGYGSASTQPAPATARGSVLANASGMTLYTLDRDPADATKSTCNGPCATNWPPLMAAATDKASGEWAIVTRDDGGHQWAYKGKPLYLWAKDSKPGDATGEGVNGVWHTAKP
ncbi:MAG TPA: hypothetical protein VJ673_22690 [Aromatoleum sp.]|uniref:COG4315 family predicted lipoprotein n=1 Tax=Aromatoleum sp. TaxID=2307007 RepID=UPI002B4675B2|nr:hypothetical protein [Aromatoleum sp.]HJV28504.1 hypothetical protein [Aromatoleum sp.]